MKKMEHDLSVLRQKVIEMGNLTEQMVIQAIDALSQRRRSRPDASYHG